MNAFRVFDSKQELAEAAAEQTIALLEHAIKKYGSATWVLAGGTAPMLAYQVIADEYDEELDWSKVTVIIGDERIGPLDGPDNSWNQIDQVLLHAIPAIKLRPDSDSFPVPAADGYEKKIDHLPKTASGLPRFDVVWLGVGQDGHTLSLFPNHAGLLPTNKLVIPVSDSPKPPNERISLTLRALTGTGTALIITSGEDKRQAVAEALKGSRSPIALASRIITTHGGHVRWLIDKNAAASN